MRKLNPVVVVAVLIGLVAVVVITALLVPQETNPAYAAAIEFVNAAGKGNDEIAMSHLSAELKNYVADNCRDGGVSACVDDYSPSEWGSFLNAVYRRAQPDGPNAWDVQLIATWEEDQGFSGVCIYTRVEKTNAESETWEIVRWSGFVSCDLPNAGLSGLAQDDAPNSAP